MYIVNHHTATRSTYTQLLIFFFYLESERENAKNVFVMSLLTIWQQVRDQTIS